MIEGKPSASASVHQVAMQVKGDFCSLLVRFCLSCRVDPRAADRELRAYKLWRMKIRMRTVVPKPRLLQCDIVVKSRREDSPHLIMLQWVL